jgi:hypothetical protein
VDYAADELLVPLKYYLCVTAHPTARAFPTFPRSSKHDQEFRLAEVSNDNLVAREHILQTLLKFNHARVFPTNEGL